MNLASSTGRNGGRSGGSGFRVVGSGEEEIRGMFQSVNREREPERGRMMDFYGFFSLSFSPIIAWVYRGVRREFWREKRGEKVVRESLHEET